MTKLWFSIFDFSFDYRGQEPGFIEERFNWTEAFENQYTSIETELFEYLKNQELEAYFNQSMVNRSNTWKTISLKWWGIEFRKRQKFFPVTSAVRN
jgi:hypothetical protein